MELEYHKRIAHYTATQLITLKDSGDKNILLKNKKETQTIVSKLTPSDFLVVCDERGQAPGSVAFAKNIAQWRNSHQRVVFVVGGAYGLGEEVLHKANVKLKLSEFTLPHELARIVLLEQTYRAFTILGGEKYHH